MKTWINEMLRHRVGFGSAVYRGFHPEFLSEGILSQELFFV